jgi:hypothetical protein
MTDAQPPEDPPPMVLLERRRKDPDEVTLLDYYAASVLIAGLGVSASDCFDKAAALVAESHRRKGFIP